MPSSEEVFRINTQRMLLYNNNWGKSRYFGFVEPPRPRLLREDGTEYEYEPPLQAAEPQADQTEEPVGAGPDELHLFDVVEPDYHPVGAYYQEARGRTFVKIRMPVEEGGWRHRWLQIF